jgi:hypothetical protein
MIGTLGRLVPLFGSVGGKAGQVHPEHRSAIDHRAHPDIVAHQPGKSLDNGKPKTKTAHRTVAHGTARLREFPKDLALLPGRMPRPVSHTSRRMVSPRGRAAIRPIRVA